MTVEGLIFDCDGTLADTMPLHWRAWTQVIQRHRIHFPEERFYALGGVPSRDILALLRQEQNLTIDPIAVSKEKEEAYLELMPRAEAIPEVVAIVRANHGKVPMAVASGGLQPVIEKVLVHLGIRHCFQAVVTSEQVTRQKPAPDIFLEAARRIGIKPEHCRAYEDTDLGLEAIRAAGMEAIDIRGLLPKAK